MNVPLALFTYFAYLFLVTRYTIKIVKYLSLPVHLRWDLYPVVHEEESHQGSSLKGTEREPGVHVRALIKEIVFLSKEYLSLVSYFRWRKSYWVAIYLCHASSVLLICFQALLFIGAIFEVLGLSITIPAVSYITVLVGVASFVTGIPGNVGLYIKRVSDADLRPYSSPLIYMSCLFNVLLCLSGLYLWYSADRDFSSFRAFWVGLVRFDPAAVGPQLAVFIVLLGLHLIYLPFTRAMHYITRLFAFFLIRWDDEPNVKGSRLEKELIRLQGQKVTWSGPHIKPGSTWSDLARGE